MLKCQQIMQSSLGKYKNMDSLSNEAIQLLNTKNESEFETLFRLYYPRLVYFSNQYVPYEVAKGLVQESFMIFWENTLSFSSELQIRSYLYTIVKNKCLMRLRHEKVKKEFFERSQAASLQSELYQSALEQLDTSEVTFKELESIIQQTIDSLSPRCREIFLLSRYEGKKNHEIASDLNISLKAVEAQITIALKVFRVTLKDYLPYLILFPYIGL